MKTYKFVDSTNKIVFIIDEDGVSRSSCLVESLPADVVILPADPLTAEQLIIKQQEEQLYTDIVTAKTYTKLTSLKNMTPTQISSWVDANVTTLAQAQDAIKTLAIAVSVLFRKL